MEMVCVCCMYRADPIRCCQRQREWSLMFFPLFSYEVLKHQWTIEIWINCSPLLIDVASFTPSPSSFRFIIGKLMLIWFQTIRLLYYNRFVVRITVPFSLLRNYQSGIMQWFTMEFQMAPEAARLCESFVANLADIIAFSGVRSHVRSKSAHLVETVKYSKQNSLGYVCWMAWVNQTMVYLFEQILHGNGFSPVWIC